MSVQCLQTSRGLLKPKIDRTDPLKIDGKEWHKIREQEFSDEIPTF
jgi:hypothetical protein